MNVGETVYLRGIVQFHHSLKYIKWQKYHNMKFDDINIHLPKYEGTTNNLQNPMLVVNNIDLDDEAEYRIEVQRTESMEFSKVHRLFVLHEKG